MEYRRDPVGKPKKIENGKKRTRKISGTRFFNFPKPENWKYKIEKYQKTKIGNTKSRNNKNENTKSETEK